jgi:membrane-bound lytic murein transglycosylase B
MALARIRLLLDTVHVRHLTLAALAACVAFCGAVASTPALAPHVERPPAADVADRPKPVTSRSVQQPRTPAPAEPADSLQAARPVAQAYIGPVLATGGRGIPATVLAAYHEAERMLGRQRPACHLTWSLLAAIGRIESGHAAGGQLDAHGTTLRPILGPVLDGSGGTAAIADTDGGRWDGDRIWDRAVGPMQFIPGTWRRHATNGKGYGTPDPNNIYDATLTAGEYLCAGGGDLSDPAQRSAAVLRYNHSDSYVRTVLAWATAYDTGVLSIPPATTGSSATTLPSPATTSTTTPPPVTTTTPAPTPTTAPPSTTPADPWPSFPSFPSLPEVLDPPPSPK